MSAISDIIQQNNPYEKFVQQMVEVESIRKNQLEAQNKEHNETKKALGNVSSAISEFVSKLTEFGNPDNKSFQPYTTSVSDESAISINSAAGVDEASNFNINIERIASNDTALSTVMPGNGTDLAGQDDGTNSITLTIGDKTETISIETTYEDDGGATVDKTNKEILESFADEIRNVFGEEAKATVFQVNNDEVQLSVQSRETGFDNRVQFSGATGALEGVTDTMTHLVPEDELDAKFTIDGVTFERSQNVVDDAIDGLSFTLLKGTGEDEWMSVQQDTETARDNVQDFIDSFNELNSTIRSNTFIDGESGSRGPLQNMRSIRNLSTNLRQQAMLPMENAGEGELAYLADIGIGFENDGTMNIEDSDLLNEVLEQRPEEVGNMFSDESSFITTMKDHAEMYTTADSGIVASLDNGLDQKISRNSDRIEAQERYLEDYEARQRQIFNELQATIDQGDAQFQQISGFRNQMGF